jgi:hypothetical protein
MQHPELIPSPNSPLQLATRWLSLTANRTIPPDQSRLCFRLIVAAMMRLPDPADVSFHYEVASKDSMAFMIRLACMTEEAAEHTTRTSSTIVRAIAPWLDVEVEDSVPDLGSALTRSVRFAIGTEETLMASAEASFLWTAVMQGHSPMRFDLVLQRLVLPQDDDGEVRVRAEATLSAMPETIDALGALVAVDAAHRAALRIISPDTSALEGELLTDIPTIARLLAGPFTVPSLGRCVRILSGSELGDMLADVLPPHALFQGGSGGGKSTLQNHAIREALRRGSVVFVLSPHRDLPIMAAHTAVAEGLEPVVYDFGNPVRHLRLNLTQPDPGVAPDEWARRLGEIIRNELWGDMPADYFGPVGQRSIPPPIEVLIRDPLGPWPLTRIPDLLDPRDDSFRDSALERIDDDRLARTIVHEVMPMVLQRDPGNSLIWLVSKLDPLIGDPTVRRIIDTRHSDVSLQPLIEGQPVIVSLPGDVLTEGGVKTIGAVLLERLWRVAQTRTNPEQLIEVFIDEWHSFPAPAIAQMLAGGRKFGIRLRLANQNLEQLTVGQREAVLANSGLIATFRTGSGDATRLDRHFPTVTMTAMQTLAKHAFAFTTGDADGVARMEPPTPFDEAEFHRLAALQFRDEVDTAE